MRDVLFGNSRSASVGVSLGMVGLGFAVACLPAYGEALAPATADASTLKIWHFDEGQGNVAADATNTSQANFAGGYSWTRGKFGNAIKLNGIDSRVLLSGQTFYTFNENESYTVDVWVKVLKAGATQQIVDSAPSFALEVRPEGFVSFNMGSLDNSVRAVCNGQTHVDDGKWHHVAAVRNAATGKLQIFVDGNLDGEVADPTAGKAKVGFSLNASLGGTPGNREMLEGSIDELRISKTARTFTSLDAPYNANEQKHYLLENAQVKIVLTAVRGKLFLSQYYDKKRKLELIEKNLPASRLVNLWQVSLRSNVGTEQMSSGFLDEEEGTLQVQRNRKAGGEELQFTWKGLTVDDGTTPATVTVRALLNDNSALSQWRINVDNKSKKFGVWTVKFPAIKNIRKLSEAGRQDYAAIPTGLGGGAGEGQLFKDPFTTLASNLRTYPCYMQSMQFNAYYGPRGGLYMAAYDGDMHLKGFNLAPQNGKVQTMGYEVHNYPADSGVAGTGFTPNYPSVLGPFGGDWYDAGKLYRQWALKQKWARLGPIATRKDLAPSIRNGAFWMIMAPENEVPRPEPLREKSRRMPAEEALKTGLVVDIDKTLKHIKESTDYFGYPVIFWCSEWYNGGGDMSPPRYIPIQKFPELLTRIHERFPKVTVSGYIAPKRYSTQLYEYNTEIERALEKDAHGKHHIEYDVVGEHGDDHAAPCWTTDVWKNYWTNKVQNLAKMGLDGFHVDELASQTNFDLQCFNREHNHPIGGGTMYAETRRAMGQIIRGNARKVNPAFASHHEALNEMYIDIDDLQEVCTSPTNNNIPLFEVVYHDYNPVMGRRIMKWFDRNTYKFSDGGGDEGIDEFVASASESFVWGNQPIWMRYDIVSYAPKVAAITKRYMDARYRAMKFLNEGEMMRQLTVTKPLPEHKTTWAYNDTPEHIQPVILNSVWKAPDGTIGIMLANITQQPQTIDYKFDLAEAGLEGKSFSLTQIDLQKPVKLGTATGTVLQRSDQVPPRSFKIIEIKPV